MRSRPGHRTSAGAKCLCKIRGEQMVLGPGAPGLKLSCPEGSYHSRALCHQEVLGLPSETRQGRQPGRPCPHWGVARLQGTSLSHPSPSFCTRLKVQRLECRMTALPALSYALPPALALSPDTVLIGTWQL